MPAELTVVIPVYNEQESLDAVVSSWVKMLHAQSVSFTILAINDGSTDHTKDVLQKLQTQYAELQVINQPQRGHGPTILYGYRLAQSPWILQIDSDNEVSPDDFPQFWKRRSEFDLGIGMRQQIHSSAIRQGVSKLAGWWVTFLFGPGIANPNFAYRLYRNASFQTAFQRLPANTFAPNIIFSGYALKKKLRILQLPVSFQMRRTGKASIRGGQLLLATSKSFIQTFIARWMMD